MSILDYVREDAIPQCQDVRRDQGGRQAAHCG
jgi:hypothetical protein